MIAEKSWKVPSALRMAIVAVAICVFPLGVVFAQDFEAVERRLGGAVEAGELSLEQANQMMEALRRSNTSCEMEAKKRKYIEVTRKLDAAVKEGTVPHKDAMNRLTEMRKAMFEQDGSKDYVDVDMEAKKRRYMEAAREIEASVKDGKVTKELAEKRLIEMRKTIRSEKTEGDNRGISVEDYRRGEAEIQKAVEKGEVSKEDAEKRLVEMRKMIRSEQTEDDNELLTKRRDALNSQCEMVLRRHQSGIATQTSVIAVSNQLLDAELQLAKTKKQRLSLYKTHLDRLRELEKLAKERYEAGVGPENDVLEAKAARLQAEIDLHREQL